MVIGEGHIPGEIPSTDRFAKVEKYPEEFDIDMIRCIFCGMCEEVCPEQAIFLRKDYAITGFTRADMVICFSPLRLEPTIALKRERTNGYP